MVVEEGQILKLMNLFYATVDSLHWRNVGFYHHHLSWYFFFDEIALYWKAVHSHLKEESKVRKNVLSIVLKYHEPPSTCMYDVRLLWTCFLSSKTLNREHCSAHSTTLSEVWPGGQQESAFYTEMMIFREMQRWKQRWDWHWENVTVVNGAGRTEQRAAVSCHACVSVSAGCFPPFKAAVMFCFLQPCSYRQQWSGITQTSKQPHLNYPDLLHHLNVIPYTHTHTHVLADLLLWSLLLFMFMSLCFLLCQFSGGLIGCFVCRITQKLINRFPRNSDRRWNSTQNRPQYILVLGILSHFPYQTGVFQYFNSFSGNNAQILMGTFAFKS